MEQVRRREDIPMTAGADRTRGCLGGYSVEVGALQSALLAPARG